MLGSCWVHKFWVITIMYMLKAMDATLVYKHDIYIYIYISGSIILVAPSFEDAGFYDLYVL